MVWVMLTAVALGLFWWGYRHPYRRRWLLPRSAVPLLAASAVDRQHRHIAAGGRVGEHAVAATAARFGELIRSGRTADVERELRPGVAYAVQVRALTALGTPEAGFVLERLLARTISRDPVEQSWYWADAAAGLRHLRRASALPIVLRCADAAAGLPAGHVLAAEAIAFPAFAAALTDLGSPTGRSALCAVATVARACREHALDPGSAVRAGLGVLLPLLSETAPDVPDPWLAAVMLEAERLARRARHWSRLLDADGRESAGQLAGRLQHSSARRLAWLSAAPARLLARFTVARPAEKLATLRFVQHFRSDVTDLFPHLPDPRAIWWADAVRCLTWSRSAAAGPLLAVQALRCLHSRRSRVRAPVLLAALRGHPCPEAEQALIRGSHSDNRTARQASAGTLGWWPPFNPAAVLGALRKLRPDPDEPTRQAATAALARLGDRAALADFAAGLHSEEPGIRAASAARIADEELSWLWPDLQELAETGDPQTALACAEAAERLREHVLGPLG